MATNPFAQIQPDQQTAAPTSDATNPFSQIAQTPDASSNNSSSSVVASAPPKSLAQHALDAFHTSLEDVGIPNTAEEISQANKMLGEQMRHPFRTAKQVGTATGRALLSTNDTDALQKSKEEYGKGNYVEAARHFINYLVPLVGGSADRAGDAVDNKEWGKAIGHVVPAILPALFGGGEERPITSNEEAAVNAARQFKETPKEVAPAGTVLGERTVLRPTTQTTAGVEAPISALQQENPSAIAKAAEKFTSPNAAKEFQRGTVIPAATRQLVSTVGQVAEDRINAHNAVMNGEPSPEKIAGTQVPSKYQTHDEAAQAAEATAQKTYRKADAASDADIAAWQQKVKQALDEHKDLIDRHNANVDEYNAHLDKDETPMPRAVYDPNTVAIPEKPQSYSELKADLDRAKANSASPDAAVREEAYKTEIPKAEKAIDGWFKQHSDIISPAEYQSAKSLYADSQRYQDIANGLRSAMNKGTVTGNTLRGLEANIDNKMIRRGQAPGAFKRLLGDDGYQNWKTVTKLFDPIKGQPSLGEQAIQWLTAGATSFLPHTYGATLLGKAGSEWLLNRVLFNPEFGAWFGKTANYLKYLATSERGELGMPDSLRNEFDNIINNKTPYTGEERRAGARPTMSATELEDAIKNRRPINNPFDQTEGARATMNRDPNMPQPAGDQQWNASQDKIHEPMQQMVSLGEGNHKISADVQPTAVTPEVMEYRGKPQPRVTSRATLKEMQPVADWFNANISDQDKLSSTAHEIAHFFLQHDLGIPTDKTAIRLGHVPFKGGISGGALETGPGWNIRYNAAQEGTESMPSFLSDYASQLMAGRAVEEMLGESREKVREHAEDDTRQVKRVLKNQGMHPALMDSFLDAATDRAKEILKDNWNTVSHMTTQAVQHYGGDKMDSATLHKYRNGEVYKPQK